MFTDEQINDRAMLIAHRFALFCDCVGPPEQSTRSFSDARSGRWRAAILMIVCRVITVSTLLLLLVLLRSDGCWRGLRRDPTRSHLNVLLGDELARRTIVL